MAARNQLDTDLSAFDVDIHRFPQQGDYYISDDFNSAENQIELEIDSDVGWVGVK